MLKQNEIAKALGIEPTLVTRYKRQGMPVDSIESAKAWRVANVRPRATVGTAAKPGAKKRAPLPKVGANLYQQARTQLAITEAQDAQLRLLERKGVLRHEGALKAEIARRLAGLRDALLQMPSRLQSVVAAETDEAKCHDLIQDEIYGVLAQLTEVV